MAPRVPEGQVEGLTRRVGTAATVVATINGGAAGAVLGSAAGGVLLIAHVLPPHFGDFAMVAGGTAAAGALLGFGAGKAVGRVFSGVGREIDREIGRTL